MRLIREGDLLFLHANFGNFLVELCGEINPETAPLQAVRCALPSTEQTTFRGGEKGQEGGGRGVASKAVKKEKRTRETDQ